LVPSHERETIKKRWRLVLERAEKVKKRIEDLGGHVGKVDPGDEGLESAVVRRGGLMNGLKLDQWTGPPTRGFDGEVYREKEPDMPDVDVVWRDIDEAEWEPPVNKDEAWIVRQGTGADCSVAAGLGVSLEHDRLWGSKVCPNLGMADNSKADLVSLAPAPYIQKDHTVRAAPRMVNM
jgi:hypothetical protein